MKRLFNKAMASFVAAIPVIAAFAITVSANNVASPTCGQPVPPETLKRYRKF